MIHAGLIGSQKFTTKKWKCILIFLFLVDLKLEIDVVDTPEHGIF